MDGRRGEAQRIAPRLTWGGWPWGGLVAFTLTLSLLGPPMARGVTPLVPSETAAPLGPAPEAMPLISDPPARLDAAPEGIVERVAVLVRPQDSSARVEIEALVVLVDDGPALTRLGLAGLTLGRVVEEGRDLPVRPLDGGWGVELQGRGEHRVAVAVLVPIRRTTAGQGVDLAIPPAASTRVALIADRPLLDARAGADEALVIAAEDPRRADGHLRPRARLDLTWNIAEPTGIGSGPPLTTRGEILIRPGADAWEMTETWTVAPLSGVVRRLVLPLAAGDGELTVQLDDHPLVGERHQRASEPGTDLHLTLPQPWDGGPAARLHRLRVESRQVYSARAADGSVTTSVAPHPPAEAVVTGVTLGVAPSEAWQVAPGDHPGWARTGPRPLVALAESKLTSDRIGDWLAFETEGRPPALALHLQPVRPRFQARMRLAVTLGAERATVAATLIGAVERGQLFEARVKVPPGLRWDPPVAGPPGCSIRLDGPSDANPPRTGSVPAAAASAVLVATFEPPLGAGQTFTLDLRGSCPVSDRGHATIPLFQTVDPAPEANELALISGQERRVEPIGEEGGATWKRVASARPLEDWAWPGIAPAPDARITWCRSPRAEPALAVTIEPSPPVVHHRSTLSVAVDRRGAEVIEEVVGDVAPGTITVLDLALPPDLADRWIVEASEGIEREPLGDVPTTGWRRFRLKLARASSTFQFRGRYRLDLDETRRLAIRPVAILTGRSNGWGIRVSADPDVTLATEAPGWTSRPEPSRTGGELASSASAVWEHPGGNSAGPLTIQVTPGRLAALPGTLASRLWLRSIQRSEGQTLLMARYRLEVHERTVTVRLPLGARWIRGTVGGIDLGPGEVEQIDPTTFRAILPPGRASGPVEFRIDAWLDDAAAPADLWMVPELVDGAVQQTVWELAPIGTRVGVGVPDDWIDENRWVRHGLIWRREPARTEAALARWIANEPPGERDPAAPNPVRPVVLTAPDPIGDGVDSAAQVRYLFSHLGPPRPLRFVTLARSTLLLVCSGPVLFVGLLVLVRRPPARWVVASLLVLAFLLAVALEANTALLVVESAALGFALMVIALVLHQLIERRGGSTAAVTINPTSRGTSAASTVVSAGGPTKLQTHSNPPVAEPTTHYPSLAPPAPNPSSEATVAVPTTMFEEGPQ